MASHEPDSRRKKNKKEKETELTFTSRAIKSQLVPAIECVHAKRYLHGVVSYQLSYDEYVGRHWVPAVHLKPQQMPAILAFEKTRYAQTFDSLKHHDYHWLSYRIDPV